MTKRIFGILAAFAVSAGVVLGASPAQAGDLDKIEPTKMCLEKVQYRLFPWQDEWKRVPC